MFRETYKNANDEIHADRSLLENVYARAERESVNVKEKRKNPIAKFTLMGTAVAAAIVFGLVFINSELFTAPLHQDNFSDIATVATEAETVNAEDDEVTEVFIEKETTPATSVVKARNTITAPSSKSKETMKTETPTEVVNAPLQLDQAEAYADVPMVASMEAPTEAESHPTKARSVENENVPVLMMNEMESDYSTEGFSEDVTFSYEEYADYLGVDVTKIPLPESMIIKTDLDYSFNTDEYGNIAYDVRLFSADDEDKLFQIIIGKDHDITQALETFGGEKSAVVTNGVYSTIYAVVGDTSLTINIENFTSAEIEAIISYIGTIQG